MREKYWKFENASTGDKYYRGIVSPPYPGNRRLCKKTHTTATKSVEYAGRVEARWARLWEVGKCLSNG